MNKRELSVNVREALRDIFRNYVGFGKTISFDDLAEGAEDSPRALRDISTGIYTPKLVPALMILSALPKGAFDILLKPLGLAVHEIEGVGCAKKTSSKLARTLADLTEGLEDGHLDHQERSALMPAAREAYEELGRFIVSEGGKVEVLPVTGKVNTMDRPA